MTLVPVGPFADLPNPQAAQQVHDLVMKMAPAEGRSFVRMLAHHGLDYDTEVHALSIHAERGARIAALEKALAASAISKAAGGAPAPAEEHAWERLQIIKAGFDLTSDQLRHNAQARKRDLQTGRFLRDARPIDYTDRLPIGDTDATALKIANSSNAAQAFGDPSLAHGLSQDQLQAYRQAYLQVATLVDGYRGQPGSFMVTRYDGDSDHEAEVHAVPAANRALPLDPSRTLAEVRVHQLPIPATPLADAARAFGATNYAEAKKGPERTGRRVGDFAGAWERTDEDAQRPAAPTLRRVGAASDLIHDLTNAGAGLPPHAQLAVQAGRYVGQFGPEAARVVTPPMDRAAYRYRGIARPGIDPALKNAVGEVVLRRPEAPLPKPHPREERDATIAAAEENLSRRTAEIKARVGQPKIEPLEVPPFRDPKAEENQHLTPAGRERLKENNIRHQHARAHNRNAAAASGLTPAEAQVALRRAKADHTRTVAHAQATYAQDMAERTRLAGEHRTSARQARRTLAIHGIESEDGKTWNPGPVLRYFRSRLPSQELTALQLKSGVTPPSEGVIITADGKAVHQSVGYGDDWYAPFTLKQLDALKGGEYVRTRAYGGLTPEDVYTGLTHGARAVTVVSHSGTFTLELDNDFKGGRRYNDKAVRMVNRYAQVLDTVKAGDVQIASPDPELDAMLREEVELTHPRELDANAHHQALRQKRRDLLTNPRVSPRRQLEVATALLEEKADELGYTQGQGDKQGVTSKLPPIQQMANTAVEAIANERYARLRAEHDDAQASYEREAELAGSMGVDPLVDPPEPLPSPAQVVGQVHDELRSAGGIGADEVVRALGYGPELDDRLAEEGRRVAIGSQSLRLDALGYKTATAALKEQFPYYVARDSFHPWGDSDARPGERDTGYIRPGRNRPAAALVGLYDPKPTPGGGPSSAKFYADSVRYQGGRKSGVPVAGASHAGEGGAPSGRAGESGGSSKADRKAAAKALVEHIRAQKFAENATLQGQQLGGMDPNELADQAGFPPALKPIFIDGDELLEDLDDPKKSAAAQAKVEEAVKYLGRKSDLFDLDRDLRDQFLQGNKAVDGKDWRHMLEYPRLDREFKGAGFKKGADLATVEATYPGLREVKAAIAAGHLPKTLADVDPDKLERTARKLKAQADAAQRQRENGRPDLASASEAELELHARGLAMAAALHRRRKEASKAENKKDRNAPRLNIAGMSPADIDALKQALGSP